MKTLYLSGVITNNPKASPIAICDDKWSWSTCMRRCIEVLVTQCDAVAIIPPEYASAGMELEMQIAERLGMQVKTVKTWVREGKIK